MPNLSDLSGIWDAPVASIAPSRSEPRNQSVDYTTTSDGSPKSMSSFFASVQPTPIGWHLNNNNNSRTTPTPSDKYKPYGTPLGPVTTNSALAMTSDGDDRADDSPQYFARRYQQLKEIEGYKNSLIKVSRALLLLTTALPPAPPRPLTRTLKHGLTGPSRNHYIATGKSLSSTRLLSLRATKKLITTRKLVSAKGNTKKTSKGYNFSWYGDISHWSLDFCLFPCRTETLSCLF